MYGSKAGQAKLRGKKSKRMNCGCCTCLNHKDKIVERVRDQEVQEFIVDQEKQ